MKYFIAIAVACISIVSCKSKGDYTKFTHDPILFSKTVYELNNVVMGNNFTPIVASRNYMYASVAAYEVIAGGFPEKYNSLAGQINQLTSVPKPDTTKKIDFEFGALLAFCKLGEAVTFPAGSMKDYVDSMKQMATASGMSEEILNNTIAYADTVAATILNWSKKDNYAETRSAPKYNVVDSPGRWVPTPPA